MASRIINLQFVQMTKKAEIMIHSIDTKFKCMVITKKF